MNSFKTYNRQLINESPLGLPYIPPGPKPFDPLGLGLKPLGQVPYTPPEDILTDPLPGSQVGHYDRHGNYIIVNPDTGDVTIITPSGATYHPNGDVESPPDLTDEEFQEWFLWWLDQDDDGDGVSNGRELKRGRPYHPGSGGGHYGDPDPDNYKWM